MSLNGQIKSFAYVSCINDFSGNVISHVLDEISNSAIKNKRSEYEFNEYEFCCSVNILCQQLSQEFMSNKSNLGLSRRPNDYVDQ